MKRKIASLLTIALLTTTLFVGCGTTNSNEIAFSKLFENDVIIYVGNSTSFGEEDQKLCKMVFCGADGSYFSIGNFYKDFDKDLKDVAQMEDEEIINEYKDTASVRGTYKLGIETDISGNNTKTDQILIKETYNSTKKESQQEGWIGYGSISDMGTFVGHVKIKDSFYMMFQKPAKYDSNYFYFIRDTEETKDKTIVFDAVGTDGIVVDMDAEEAFK